jgi:hypothetical protein
MILRYTPKGRNPPCSYGSDFKPRKLRVTNQWQRFECRESSCEIEPEPETETCREATLAPPAGARLLTDLIHVPIPQGILARAAQRKGLLHADEELRRTTIPSINPLDQNQKCKRGAKRHGPHWQVHAYCPPLIYISPHPRRAKLHRDLLYSFLRDVGKEHIIKIKTTTSA